jgi:hypothetical protein
MDSSRDFNAAYVVLAVVADLVAQYAVRFTAGTEALSYSEFETRVAEHAIRSAVVTDRHILGEFNSPRKGKTRFELMRVDPELAAAARARRRDAYADAGIGFRTAPREPHS